MDTNTATVIVTGINAVVAIFTAWMTVKNNIQSKSNAAAAEKVSKKVDELVTISKR